jgi:WD40 repeat protein
MWKLGTSMRFNLRAPTVQKERSFGRGTYHVEFSPGAKWLVGRQSFEPFVTWDLSKETDSVGVLSAGKPPASGSDRSPLIWYSPGADWVVGLANDQRLHLWQPTQPPGLTRGKGLLPGNYEGDSSPSVAFSTTGNFIAVLAPDGNLYSWQLGGATELGTPVVRHYAGAQMKFSSDSLFIYSADSSGLYLGRVGEKMSIVANSKSAIQAVAVAPDAEHLMVLAENHVIVAKRYVYLWGIPIWKLQWPTITQPLRLQEG